MATKQARKKQAQKKKAPRPKVAPKPSPTPSPTPAPTEAPAQAPTEAPLRPVDVAVLELVAGGIQAKITSVEILTSQPTKLRAKAQPAHIAATLGQEIVEDGISIDAEGDVWVLYSKGRIELYHDCPYRVAFEAPEVEKPGRFEPERGEAGPTAEILAAGHPADKGHAQPRLSHAGVGDQEPADWEDDPARRDDDQLVGGDI